MSLSKVMHDTVGDSVDAKKIAHSCVNQSTMLRRVDITDWNYMAVILKRVQVKDLNKKYLIFKIA